jgi:RNA polymerase sigma-70 factor (ECF subfamily)
MRLDDATADDIAQGFIADRILDRDLVAAADPNKGRFRSLLLRSLTNYTIDVLRKRSPGARGPALIQSEEDAVPIEGVEKPQADPFDVAWARGVLSRALATMRAECDAQGCSQRWTLFHRRVLQPLFDDHEPPAYDELLREFQFISPQQASNALITAKRHFQRVLCQVVGEYAEGDAEISSELMDLRSIVEAAGPLNIYFGEFVASGEPRVLSSQHDDSTQHVRQLAELLLIENEPESPWRVEEYPSLWQHQLDQSLTSIVTVVGHLHQSERLIDRSDNASVATVKDLLHHDSPSLESLSALKDAARGYVRADQNDFPAELATALYFACIAVGIVRRQMRISKSDDIVLEYGFRLLVGRPWLDDQTRRIVQHALERIRTA